MKLLPIAAVLSLAVLSIELGMNGHPVLASIGGYLTVAFLLLLITNHNANKLNKRRSIDVTVHRLSCEGCGVDITTMPFAPDLSRPVYCGDCNPAAKNLGKPSVIIPLAVAEKYIKNPKE